VGGYQTDDKFDVCSCLFSMLSMCVNAVDCEYGEVACDVLQISLRLFMKYAAIIEAFVMSSKKSDFITIVPHLDSHSSIYDSSSIKS